MPASFLHALSPVLALSINCIVQVILAMNTKMRLLQTVALGAVCGELVFLIMTLPYLNCKWLVVGNGAYIAASFCYFAFVNLNATSLRIRILEELRNSGGRMMSADLLKRYGGDAVLNARLERLLRSKFIVRSHSRFFGGKKYPLYVSKFFDSMRFLLLKR